MLAAAAVAAPEPHLKREAEAVAEAEADPEPFYAGLPTIAGVAPFAHAPVAHAAPVVAPVAHAAPVVAPVAHSIPQAVTKKIEAPCTEVVTEHCVDVPIVKEVVTPVETCHVVTKVTCTPAVHSIPKVTCEPGTAEIVHHVPGYAHLG